MDGNEIEMILLLIPCCSQNDGFDLLEDDAG